MACSITGLHALVLHAQFPANTPERAAFKAHLVAVSAALKAIAYTEDGGQEATAEANAIRACLPMNIDLAGGATALAGR